METESENAVMTAHNIERIDGIDRTNPCPTIEKETMTVPSMRKADLHVHTDAGYDEYGFGKRKLKFYGTMDPLSVYRLAKERGMDYVTFTDHNTLDGVKRLEDALNGLPADFFPSVEITTHHPSFPSEIHVNAYNITREQHEESQRLRPDVRELTAYLGRERVLYSWEHLADDTGAKQIDPRLVGELMPLFPTVQVINGLDLPRLNAIASRFAHEHGKPMIAGSDSHTDRVGMTYTKGVGDDPRGFLESIARGECEAAGEHGTHERFVRHILTIVQHNFGKFAKEELNAFKRGVYSLLHTASPRIVPGFVRLYHSLQERSYGALDRDGGYA